MLYGRNRYPINGFNGPQWLGHILGFGLWYFGKDWYLEHEKSLFRHEFKFKIYLSHTQTSTVRHALKCLVEVAATLHAASKAKGS